MPRILIKDAPCAILILAIERSVHAVMEWLRLASFGVVGVGAIWFMFH